MPLHKLSIISDTYLIIAMSCTSSCSLPHMRSACAIGDADAYARDVSSVRMSLMTVQKPLFGASTTISGSGRSLICALSHESSAPSHRCRTFPHGYNKRGY